RQSRARSSRHLSTLFTKPGGRDALPAFLLDSRNSGGSRTVVKSLRGVLVSAGVATLAAVSIIHVWAADDGDVAKRLAALEAQQKQVVEELQQIKALLQNRAPASAPAQNAAALLQ